MLTMAFGLNAKTFRRSDPLSKYLGSALCSGFEEFGPVREVVERGSMRVVELEGCNRDGAVADGGHVGVGFDALNLLLLVQPEVAAAARIGAGLEHVPRDLRRLAGETNFTGPQLGHVDVQQDAGREPFFQYQRREDTGEICRGSVVELLALVRNGNGDGGDAIDSAFHGCSYGTGVINVFAHVTAAVDAGDDQVGFLFKQGVKSENHGVGRRAFDGVFVLGNLIAVNGLAQGERLRGSAAFVRRRDNGNLGDGLHGFDERAETGGVYAVVIRDEDMRLAQIIRHGNSRAGGARLEALSREGKMVGTTGFEPATSRTPSVRATRLRYVPTAFGQQSAYHSRSRRVKTARSSSCKSRRNFR